MITRKRGALWWSALGAAVLLAAALAWIIVWLQVEPPRPTTPGLPGAAAPEETGLERPDPPQSGSWDVTPSTEDRPRAAPPAREPEDPVILNDPAGGGP